MITSTQNNQVKMWKRLQRKRERLKTGTFLVEGYHLIEEAFKSNWNVQEIIVKENTNIPPWCTKEMITIVTAQVFAHISQTTTPQGIIAIIKMNKYAETITGNQVLLIDQVQDPGNLGTMIRTADAAGFSAVILGEGTVDLYNDKVIRSTQGSIFHIPIYQANLLEEISILKKEGFTIWAAALEQAKMYQDAIVKEKTALIVGNEGAGISQSLLHEADTIVKIPIYGKAESLNVSVAAGILMYHVTIC